MGCISVQGAVWKGVLALVGDLWNPCSAGPCKFYVAIIIGLCARSKLAGLTNLTRSRTGEFYLSAIVHHICTLNRLTHSSGILNNNVTSVFEAGIAIQQWRAEVNKVRDLSSCGILRPVLVKLRAQGGSLCYASLAQPHAVQNAAILHCKECRKGHCFVHLAEAGIHSSEAITLYKKSLEQSTWHEFHLSKKTSPDEETILAAEASGDNVSSLIGQKRAIVALSYSHCQPLNNASHIKPGWYDRPTSTGVAVRATRLIGYTCVSNSLTP
jgi:hypothetical protein